MFAVTFARVLPAADQHRTSNPEYYSGKCEETEAAWDAYNNAQKSKNAQGKSNTDYRNPAEKPNKTDYCDLAAQYVSARAAETSGNWTIYATILAGLGLAALIGNLWLIQRDTDASKKSGFLERRPWLRLEVNMTGPPDMRPPNIMALDLDIKAFNHGSNPAIDLDLDWSVHIDTIDEAEVFKAIIARRVARKRRDGGWGVAFPNQKHTFGNGRFARPILQDGNYSYFTLVVGVTYRSPESDEIFCTAGTFDFNTFNKVGPDTLESGIIGGWKFRPRTLNTPFVT